MPKNFTPTVKVQCTQQYSSLFLTLYREARPSTSTADFVARKSPTHGNQSSRNPWETDKQEVRYINALSNQSQSQQIAQHNTLQKKKTFHSHGQPNQDMSMSSSAISPLDLGAGDLSR